jgi:hypothetical protein
MSVISSFDHESKYAEGKVCTKEPDVSWNEFRKNLNSATPLVIRKGLCMVRNQGIEMILPI